MNLNKRRIFISAYACEPNLGSEIGVGWHWVLEMSKYFDLWVLTRQSNKEGIENWLLENPIQNKINFVYFDLPKKLRFWKKGRSGVRAYYILWQKFTNRIVKRTMEENGIEIYHLLTYGNALWPISNYGQQQFFIWGPTSSGDTIPVEYSKYYSLKGRLIEFLRRSSVKTLPLNTGFIKRCKNANLIFCKTESTLNSIPKQHRKKAMVFTDVGVELIETKTYATENKDIEEVIKYFAVGHLDSWRGFDLLIEAFAKAVKKNPAVRLEILGKGSDSRRLKTLIKKLKMSSFISLIGQAPMEVYYQKMANCDVVVNPSLKEGGVTTAFDSMSFGKPLICIDTGGYTRFFNNEYAVVIPRTSRTEVISNLTAGLLQLTVTVVRELKGKKAKEYGKQFDWHIKGQLIFKEIENSFNQFQLNER